MLSLATMDNLPNVMNAGLFSHGELEIVPENDEVQFANGHLPHPNASLPRTVVPDLIRGMRHADELDRNDGRFQGLDDRPENRRARETAMKPQETHKIRKFFNKFSKKAKVDKGKAHAIENVNDVANSTAELRIASRESSVDDRKCFSNVQSQRSVLIFATRVHVLQIHSCPQGAQSSA